MLSKINLKGLGFFVILTTSMMSLAQKVNQFEMLVYLKSKPDFASLNLVTDRNYKLRVMYSGLVRNAQVTQESLKQIFQQRGYQWQSFYINNMILVHNADMNLAQELARHPAVERLSYNNVFRARPLPIPGTPAPISSQAIEPSLSVIKADQVWTQFKAMGQGVVIAGQDTGIQWDHPALIRQYRGTTTRGVIHDYNWHDAIKKPVRQNVRGNKCGYNSKTPCDDSGHGTHTVATVLGDDGGNNKVGVAPQAKWIGCRNMDNGYGTVASYIECFEFFFAPYPMGGDPQKDGKPEYAPHVMNNSWGCPTSEGCKGDEFVPVLKTLMQAGIMVVASAGNEGSGCKSIGAPPAYHSDLTFSVGAANNNMVIASFSSRGPSAFDGAIGPDIVAPGVSIRSAVPGNSYERMSGTSMSGPHVVGMIALLWSANKNYIGKIAETADIIRKTATPLKSNEVCGGVSGQHIPNNTYGYGMVNALAATQAMLTGRY